MTVTPSSASKSSSDTDGVRVADAKDGEYPLERSERCVRVIRAPTLVIKPRRRPFPHHFLNFSFVILLQIIILTDIVVLTLQTQAPDHHGCSWSTH